MKKNGRDQIDSPPPLAVASVKTRKAEIEIDRQETRKGRERVRKKSSPEMSSPPSPCRRRDAVAGMPLPWSRSRLGLTRAPSASLI
uniref:Uncharacterized protein n=1 Tax=Fagus sylvatica TaxID=28930 RepID=A0A2N9ESN8_FAGSY